MPIRALTFDFWNTMVVARANGGRRRQQRLRHVLEVVRAGRPEATETAVEAACHAAESRFDAAWRRHHTTPPTTELVGCIWDALGLAVDPERHAETVRVFEEGLLYGPPAFAEGFEAALAWAAGRYRLGIVSDTMFSPGRVIRRLLEERGVLHHFDAFVFSDETGFSKPDPRAIRQAGAGLGVAPEELVHVGDLRRTDVAGGRGAGARTLLFTGVCLDDTAEPVPDAVLSCWRDLPDVLVQLAASG